MSKRKQEQTGDDITIQTRQFGLFNKVKILPPEELKKILGAFTSDAQKLIASGNDELRDELEAVISRKIQYAAAEIVQGVRDVESKTGEQIVQAIQTEIEKLISDTVDSNARFEQMFGDIQEQILELRFAPDELKKYLETTHSELEAQLRNATAAIENKIEQATIRINAHTTEELDNVRRERVQALLHDLHEEIQKPYIDGDKIEDICGEIKGSSATDKEKRLAEFYAIICGNNDREKNKYISAFDPLEYKEHIQDICRISIIFMSRDTALSTGALLERAYQCGLFKEKEYNYWLKEYEQESKKLNGDIYNVNKERHVFIAYKNENLKEVMELCEYLESVGLDCFVAARNLQHSTGANYKNKIKTALRNSRALVFVSSYISRHEGDAIAFELDYVQEMDREFANAAGELYAEYSDIPEYCKLPRAEYLLEKYRASETKLYIIDALFNENNWIHGDRDELVKYINEKIRKRKVDISAKVKEGRNDAKYCLDCGTSNPLGNNYCSKCGKTEFGTYKDWCDVLTARDRKQLELEREELEHTRARLENEAKKRIADAERKAKEAQAEAERKVKEVQAEAERRIAEADNIREVEPPIRVLRSVLIKAPESPNELEQPTPQVDSVITPKRRSFGTPTPVLSNYDESEFEINGVTLVKYKGKGDDVKIPGRVKFIGSSAFYNCSRLTSIKIPNGVWSIGDWVFSGCWRLMSVEIPNSVTSIGKCVFWGCSSLTSIEIPNSVTSIGDSAFKDCISLKRIKMPKRFKREQKNIFEDRYKEIDFTFTK